MGAATPGWCSGAPPTMVSTAVLMGITGTLGAGKGAVVELLIKKHGFLHFSVRSYLTGLVEERGLPVNRDTLVQVANELREANGPGYIAEQLLVEAKRGMKDAPGAIIESVRTLGEVEAMKRAGGSDFVLLAVDAPVEVRFERVKRRGSATDEVTWRGFVEDEEREMNNKEPHKQNLRACIEASHYRIMNDSTLEVLDGAVEAALRFREAGAAVTRY